MSTCRVAALIILLNMFCGVDWVYVEARGTEICSDVRLARVRCSLA
jgi:hypothetical protein